MCAEQENWVQDAKMSCVNLGIQVASVEELEACKEMADNIAKRVRHSILILGDGRGHSIPLFFCTIYCQG